MRRQGCGLPLNIRMPGANPRSVDALVSLLDITPTMLELAGSSWDRQTVQGESLRPLLNGIVDRWRGSVVTEFCSFDDLVMTLWTLRAGQWYRRMYAHYKKL